MPDDALKRYGKGKATLGDILTGLAMNFQHTGPSIPHVPTLYEQGIANAIARAVAEQSALNPAFNSANRNRVLGLQHPMQMHDLLKYQK